MAWRVDRHFAKLVPLRNSGASDRPYTDSPVTQINSAAVSLIMHARAHLAVWNGAVRREESAGCSHQPGRAPDVLLLPRRAPGCDWTDTDGGASITGRRARGAPAAEAREARPSGAGRAAGEPGGDSSPAELSRAELSRAESSRGRARGDATLTRRPAAEGRGASA